MTAVAGSKPLIYRMETGDLTGLHLNTVFEFLAEFHSESAQNPRLMNEFANPTFRDFKLGLQYEDIARNLPRRQAEIVLRCAEEYKNRHDCMTYGDMNSRNLLVDQSDASIYMIDFEQAHVGSQDYDLAYILSEFLISALYHENPKIIHYMHDMLDAYFGCAFSDRRLEIESRVSNHLAVQVIYRFLGPSKQSWTYYVREESKSDIIASATSWLAEDPGPVSLLLEDQLRELS